MSLYDAVFYNSPGDIRRMLEDPSVDPNAASDNNHNITAFMIACVNGNPETVRLFLDNPRLTNYNQRDDDGLTALHYTCRYYNKSILEMLVADRRIDVTVRANNNSNCFFAVPFGREPIGAMRVLLASDRPEIAQLVNDPGVGQSTPRIEAQAKGFTQVVELIDAYNNDPIGTRQQLRMEFGYPAHDASELFATIILLCDDYYEIKE